MASPDDPDATVGAANEPAAAPAPAAERIDLPVYRPRRRVAVVFWCAFLAAAVAAAILVWLLLA
jgi:hypothetical protein